MWFLVVFVIILLFIGASNQKIKKTENKKESHERWRALEKAELEENIKNKEKYENILLKLRKKMAIKELSDKEIEEIDNKISYTKECIDFFEAKIYFSPVSSNSSLYEKILQENYGNRKKTRKKIDSIRKEYKKRLSPEKEKIIKLYQQILENE